MTPHTAEMGFLLSRLNACLLERDAMSDAEYRRARRALRDEFLALMHGRLEPIPPACPVTLCGPPPRRVSLPRGGYGVWVGNGGIRSAPRA